MMGTYYDGGSEMQTGGGGAQEDHDNLQTLYLMNPNFIAATNYTEAQQQQQQQQTPSNMVFLNPSNTISLPTNNYPHHHQQFIGIPLAGGGSGSPSSSSLQHHHIPASTLHALSVSRVHPNLWGPPPNPTPDLGDPMGFRRPVGPQGLSLSLSPGQGGQQHQSQVTTVAGGAGAGAGCSNGVIIGSKYLKAAQELLEEVANVGGHCSNFNHKTTTTASGNCNNNDDNNPSVVDPSGGVHKDKAKGALNDVGEEFSHGGSGGESSNVGGSKKAAVELTTPQRQELQMKKAKLLNMLDEVEQRYRQYDSQMQVVLNSFEEAAGIGSAKLYTSLALKTISKQFRCLKDAIMSQIKATSKSLGEEESNNNNNGKGVKLEGGGVAGSRLRFVDQQLRQQRALQQLGMMQHNAWRPQRGLPERAVSVLRAWLFEHFLHPYPKDSDKHMLAKQTGLTRSQVSNWFINARVRLWKPMVEEMYLEEMKTQENNTPNSEDNNITNNKNGNSSPKNDPSSTTTLNPQHEQHQDHHESGITNDMISNLSAICTPSTQGFTLIGSSSDMESLIARSPKKQRSNSDLQNSPSSILSMDMEMKPLDHHQRHSFLMTNQGNDGFNPYIVNEIAGRFNPDQMTAHPYHGNAVSLTLGLPHCENLSLGNHHQQNFIPNQGIQMGRRIEVGAGGENEYCGISMAQPSHPNNAYQSSIDIQNRKRFAAHQLLHDFVA